MSSFLAFTSTVKEKQHKALFPGLCRYIKIRTYPRRFFHPGPAATPVTDTDIGLLLSAPHTRTGSLPSHKCEHLMATRETQHLLTRGERRGNRLSSPHTSTLPHPRSHFSSSSHPCVCVQARRLCCIFRY